MKLMKALNNLYQKGKEKTETLFYTMLAAVSMMLITNPVLAQTCDTTSQYSACSLASAIDFTELMKGIMIIATAVVGIGVLIFGAKLIINWARGRIG